MWTLGMPSCDARFHDCRTIMDKLGVRASTQKALQQVA